MNAAERMGWLAKGHAIRQHGRSGHFRFANVDDSACEREVLERQALEIAFQHVTVSIDPEKALMRRQIEELSAAFNQLTRYVQQVTARQSASVSLLEEMTVSAEAKATARDVVIPQSLVDALANDDD